LVDTTDTFKVTLCSSLEILRNRNGSLFTSKEPVACFRLEEGKPEDRKHTLIVIPYFL
jgi:hypothetical protein